MNINTLTVEQIRWLFENPKAPIWKRFSESDRKRMENRLKEAQPA